MALYPKIQSPCPLQGQLAAAMDGDICRRCNREVVDMSTMSDAARVAYLNGCSGAVCVSYRLPVGSILAAALAASALMAPGLASAQSVSSDGLEEVVIVGAIKDPANTEFVSDDGDAPELPVVYEDKGAAKDAAADDASDERDAGAASSAGRTDAHLSNVGEAH